MPELKETRGPAAVIVMSCLVGFTLTPSPVSATCGSAACFLVSGTTQGLLEPGSFRLDLSYQYVDQSRLREESEEVDHVVTPRIDLEHGEIVPLQHREVRTQNLSATLAAQYGVSSRFQVQALLPLVVLREHEHFDAVEPEDDEHHDAVPAAATANRRAVPTHGPTELEFTDDDGTLGLGDLQIGGRYGVVMTDRDLLTAAAMIKLPTGPHDLLDHHGEVNEPSLQPGSGSTDLGLMADWARQIGTDNTFELFASAGWWLRGGNEFDYAIGDEASLGVGVRFSAGRKLRPSLQLNWRSAARDTLGGEEVPSTGVREIAITPGVLCRMSDGVTLYGHLQIPVHQHVNEEQLARGTALLLGVNRMW